MNLEELAAELISFMQDAYPGVLAEKYTINEKQNSYSVLEAIAESRHCLVRGNELDTAKAAGMLLDDFRNGRLGRITLEFVRSIQMSKEDNKEEAPEQEQSIWRSLGGTLLYLLVIVLLTWVIVTFVGQRTKVDGHSMEPTLSDGDNLIVDKLSYRFRDPERYDIIVFPYQHAENTYYIKRIIGLPGETVQVIDGYMYINGKSWMNIMVQR